MVISHNYLILISGIPGTGKTTFASWLSSELKIPLVSYDSIKSNLHSEYWEVLWFMTEEICKSSSPVIVEYIFTDMCNALIDEIVNKYGYKTISIHFNADIDVAYKRVIERNKNPERHKNLAINVDFDTFSKGVQANRNFSFGEYRIDVDTNNFDNVSYEKILEQIKCLVI